MLARSSAAILTRSSSPSVRASLRIRCAFEVMAGLSALRPQHGARELQEVVDTRHEREEHDRPERVLADLEEPAELIAEDQQGDAHDLGDHLALAERGGADGHALLCGDGAKAGDGELAA